MDCGIRHAATMSCCSKESRSSTASPSAVATTWVSTGIVRPEGSGATRPAVTRNGRTAGTGQPGSRLGGGLPSAMAALPPRSALRRRADAVLQFEHELGAERAAGTVREQRYLVRDVPELRVLVCDDDEHGAAADRGDQDMAALQVDDDLVETAETVV